MKINFQNELDALYSTIRLYWVPSLIMLDLSHPDWHPTYKFVANWRRQLVIRRFVSFHQSEYTRSNFTTSFFPFNLLSLRHFILARIMLRNISHRIKQHYQSRNTANNLGDGRDYSLYYWMTSLSSHITFRVDIAPTSDIVHPQFVNKVNWKASLLNPKIVLA